MHFPPPPQPNSDFVDVLMHPRFGRIMGLAANRDIAEGEEITVNYNYGDDGDGPAWYSEAEKGESLQPTVRGVSDKCCPYNG